MTHLPSPARTAPRLLTSLPQVYAAAAVRLALPLAVLPLVASRLGAEEFGRLGFILVWSGLLAALVEGGFLAAATRLAVSADAPRRWQIAQQVFTARCLLSLPAVVLAFAAVHWAAPDTAHPLADSFAIAALACALGWPATWYLQATHQLDRWARVEILVYGSFTLLCWWLARSVAVYVVLQLAASALLAALGWRWLRSDLAGVASGADAARAIGAVGPAGRPPLCTRAALAPGLRLGATMLPVSIAGAAYSLALPAAASAQLGRAELGVFFMADRIVRALLAVADPVFSLVYPRIVALFAQSGRAALWYAARWAAFGTLAGALGYGLAQAAWPWLEPMLAARAGGIDVVRVHAVAAILAGLWPLLLGWKFIGYWMLGSARHDTAYRASVIAGGVAGVAAAASVGGAAGAPGLAWTALGVELLVIAVAVTGMLIGRARRRGR